MPNITTFDEASDRAKNDPEMRVWNANLATGTYQEFSWVKFEVGSVYPLHSHPWEQSSVVIKGRMRLTVGDEVREVGPGDMWFAPPNVPHGGEILGNEPVIFVEVYSPPGASHEEDITYY